jgi:hypothetical protein
MPGLVPDVKIFFHGQLLLRSEDGTACEVGVNPLATDHVLLVEVRTKTPGKPDLINMKHIGALHFRQPEGMTIELTDVGNVPAPAAWKCITLDPLDYEKGVGAPDEDFRWMLNLEGPLFHKMKLKPTVFGTQHVIKLKGGEYFFHTAAVKAGGSLDLKRTGGGEPPRTIKGFGAIASASVFLVENQSILLKWNDGRGERVLTLTKSKSATYEIYIENTPLFVPADPSNLSKHDELAEYYKVIREVSSTAPGRGSNWNRSPPPRLACRRGQPQRPLPGHDSRRAAHLRPHDS